MYIQRKLFVVGLIVLATLIVTACNSGSKGEKSPTPKVDTGSISGVVTDAETNAPLDQVKITASNSSGAEVASVTTNATGNYKIALPANQFYSLTLTSAAHHTEIYSNIFILVNEENILETVLKIDIAINIVTTGQISGTVLNAITGVPVPDASLSFRKGINIRIGTVLGTTTTDTFGNYSINTLQTGSYTAEISLTGYNTIYITNLVIGGQVRANQNSAISPILGDGETRIVLSWGATPLDLDSHLTGPDATNSLGRFSVYFAQVGDATKAPFVGLDVDDTDSYGPETITIKLQSPGVYRYSVHDFTNLSLSLTPGSTALASSGAKVSVYQGKASPRVFNVPTGVGVLWTVFELNGTTINPINSMGDTTNERTIP